MGLVDDLERRLEQAVEGFFSKAFKSKVQPAEIGRRLLKEQEAGRSVSVGAVYVPNEYVVRLSGEDFSRFEGLLPAMRAEFATLLRSSSEQERWQFPGPVSVRFETTDAMRTGKFEVVAEHSAGPADPSPPKLPLLRMEGDPRTWTITPAGLRIGRHSSCEVVIEDPDVSRNHAQIVSRDDGWWIVDSGSVNGTHVNDVVVKERRLKHADRLQVVSATFVFELTGD